MCQLFQGRQPRAKSNIETLLHSPKTIPKTRFVDSHRIQLFIWTYSERQQKHGRWSERVPEPPPIHVHSSASTWINNAGLPCWPLYSQQVPHQRWIGGSRRQESIHPGFEAHAGQTSPEVQNRGISGSTKRTSVLQKFILKKVILASVFATRSVCEQTLSEADRFVQKRRIYYCNPGNKWLSNLMAFSAYWAINRVRVIPLMRATWCNVLTLCNLSRWLIGTVYDVMF